MIVQLFLPFQNPRRIQWGSDGQLLPILNPDGWDATRRDAWGGKEKITMEAVR